MYSNQLRSSRFTAAFLSSCFLYVGTEHRTVHSSQVRQFKSSNPLLHHQNLPKFSKIKSSDVEPAINECLAAAKSDFTDVETSFKADKSPSYASTIEALEMIQYPLSYSWGITNHLAGVKNSEDLRKCHEAVQPKVIAFTQRVGQSRRLFKALNALKKNPREWGALDGAQRRIVDAYLRDMENAGVGLSESDRKTFNKLQLEVSELNTKFSNNVLDSTNNFKLKVTHVSDVEGLPMSARALAAEKAKFEGSPEVRVCAILCA
jgi:oligopeptidase A